MTKPARRRVHGVLLLDKPLGLTSTRALAAAKRLYRADKAGHTGTLDPLASGLLPLCFGAATKFAQAALEADKHYVATLRLGQTTASADAETPVLEERPVHTSEADLRAVLARFVGEQRQVPPLHSALKQGGVPLYRLARRGEAAEPAPRRVQIHHIELLRYAAPLAEIAVHCGKGTYIRSLARDVGAALGCGAHLAGLQRSGSGGLRLEQAHTLEQLEALSEAQRDALLLNPQTLVAGLPEVRLSAHDAGAFLTGQRRRMADAADCGQLRVLGPDGAFLGTAHIQAGTLIAQRLLSPLEVSALAGR